MTPTEELLLNEMRYISSISTGQVQRTAKTALAIVAAMNPPLGLKKPPKHVSLAKLVTQAITTLPVRMKSGV